MRLREGLPTLRGEGEHGIGRICVRGSWEEKELVMVCTMNKKIFKRLKKKDLDHCILQIQQRSPAQG